MIYLSILEVVLHSVDEVFTRLKKVALHFYTSHCFALYVHSVFSLVKLVTVAFHSDISSPGQ